MLKGLSEEEPSWAKRDPNKKSNQVVMYKDIVNHLTPVFCYFFHTFPWHVSQLEETENFHAAFSVAFRPLSPNTDQ